MYLIKKKCSSTRSTIAYLLSMKLEARFLIPGVVSRDQCGDISVCLDTNTVHRHLKYDIGNDST